MLDPRSQGGWSPGEQKGGQAQAGRRLDLTGLDTGSHGRGCLLTAAPQPRAAGNAASLKLERGPPLPCRVLQT